MINFMIIFLWNKHAQILMKILKIVMQVLVFESEQSRSGKSASFKWCPKSY